MSRTGKYVALSMIVLVIAVLFIYEQPIITTVRSLLFSNQNGVSEFKQYLSNQGYTIVNIDSSSWVVHQYIEVNRTTFLNKAYEFKNQAYMPNANIEFDGMHFYAYNFAIEIYTAYRYSP